VGRISGAGGMEEEGVSRRVRCRRQVSMNGGKGVVSIAKVGMMGARGEDEVGH
jgi:hypothetical protein